MKAQKFTKLLSAIESAIEKIHPRRLPERTMGKRLASLVISSLQAWNIYYAIAERKDTLNQEP